MLLKEYVNRTDMKTFGMRISTKSKINDITQTLKAVDVTNLDGFCLASTDKCRFVLSFLSLKQERFGLKG
jgi:hypothetical protein